MATHHRVSKTILMLFQPVKVYLLPQGNDSENVSLLRTHSKTSYCPCPPANSEDKDAQATERLVTKAGRKALLLSGDIGQRLVAEVIAAKLSTRSVQLIS